MSQARPLGGVRLFGAMAAVVFGVRTPTGHSGVLGGAERHAPASRHAARLGATPPARQAFADLPGVRLWFTDTGGNGEPVVLMHPITGTSESWEPQIATLAKAGLPCGRLRSARLGKEPRRPGHRSAAGSRLRGSARARGLSIPGPVSPGWRGGRRVRRARLRRVARRSAQEPRRGRQHRFGERRGDSGLHRPDRDPGHPRASRALSRGRSLVSRRQSGGHRCGGSRSMSTRASRTRRRSRCVHRTLSRSWPRLPCARSSCPPTRISSPRRV